MELGVGMLLWATGSSLASSRWSGALFLGHSAIFILFCSISACKHALLNRPAGTKGNRFFLEVSSRTSSSPNAGWAELNTDGECFSSFFGTDIAYCVMHKYLLLHCMVPRGA